MEVEYNQFSKNELITNLRSNQKNSIISLQEIKSLLNYFLSLEEQDNFNNSSANCLILLLCMSEEYEEANLRRAIYKVKKLYSSNEEFCQIFSISKRLSKEPFIDIYGHLYFFLRSNSIEVNTIASAYIKYYEKMQANFISKFYSKIKLSTLRKLLGRFN
jgi:hypothetical protein